MCTKRILTAALVLQLLLVGCQTYYYKRFVFGGQPRYPNTEFRARDLWWVVLVDVWPSSAAEYRDSTYALELRVLRSSSETCSLRCQAVLKSLQVRRLVLHVGDTVVHAEGHIHSRLDPDSPASSHTILKFDPIRIPDAVDTITVDLSASYTDSTGTAKTFDTTLTMWRMSGKRLEWAD